MLASRQSLTHTQVQRIVITEANAGQRIDNFLTTLLRGVPKSHIYRILRKGEVRVNKGRINASYRLLCGDMIRIPPTRTSSSPVPRHPGAKLIKLLEASICYESDELLVINKPAGLAVHGGSGISLGLIEVLRLMRKEAPFLELVHRLDRDTSGCIMIAKKRAMLTHLHHCLQTGKIDKRYLAVVKGQWKGGKKVEAPLYRYVLPSGERLVRVDKTGKFSRTDFEVKKMFGHQTLLEVNPLSGRTHQIRVHCNFVGHPIIGDQKYGDQDANNEAKKRGLDRLFLHASKLVIQLPNGTNTLTIKSPLPNAFEQLISN